ncbi:MAG: hypothetical protein PVJ57_16060 [Phycisphaerae bacterium]|jgi:hypothetical protein
MEAGGPFLQDVETVLQRIRSTLAAVVAAVPPRGTLVKAAQLQRALKLDKKLSWKLAKIIVANSPFSVAPYVPGPANMTHFLQAAARCGVPREVIEAAAKAGEEFQKVVESHAGDRTAFDSMISSLAGTADADQIIQQQRRTVFRGQRLIFGVHAKALISTVIFRPASDTRLMDYVHVKGFISLRRLRPDSPLLFAQYCTFGADGEIKDIRREPIDPVPDGGTGIAMLREFCSQPLPEHRIVQACPGVLCAEFVSDGLGKKAAITCFEGHLAPGGAIRRGEDGAARPFGGGTTIRVPCETLLLDVLVHEEMRGQFTPRVFTCADYMGGVTAPHLSDKSLHLEPRESIDYVGKGPSALSTPDYTRYEELGRYVFERLGWDGERFDVFRCRVEYPVLPSSVIVSFDPPGAS